MTDKRKDEMPDLKTRWETWWHGTKYCQVVNIGYTDQSLRTASFESFIAGYNTSVVIPPVPDDVAEQIRIWLRAQANAEQEPKAKSAFVEAHNAALKIIRAASTPSAEVKTVAHNMGERFSFADEKPSAEVRALRDARAAMLVLADQRQRAIDDVKMLREAIEDALGEIEYDYTNAKMVAVELRKALNHLHTGKRN